MSESIQTTLSEDGDCLVFSVPMKFRRRGGRKEIIVPAGMEGAAAEEERRNEGLALTIARAHRWRDLLESGRYATVGELARAVDVDNSYLARMLRLTLLAPDIIEAILNGTEPDGLSLKKLYAMPTGWEEQRSTLGRRKGTLLSGNAQEGHPLSPATDEIGHVHRY